MQRTITNDDKFPIAICSRSWATLLPGSWVTLLDLCGHRPAARGSRPRRSDISVEQWRRKESSPVRSSILYGLRRRTKNPARFSGTKLPATIYLHHLVRLSRFVAFCPIPRCHRAIPLSGQKGSQSPKGPPSASSLPDDQRCFSHSSTHFFEQRCAYGRGDRHCDRDHRRNV
jgi:hypothetical protein